MRKEEIQSMSLKKKKNVEQREGFQQICRFDMVNLH